MNGIIGMNNLLLHPKLLGEQADFVDPKVPERVISAPPRKRQILLNLLNNAVKFTVKGEVVLTVAVRDTAIGIPSDRQVDLFQSFTQADATTTRRFGSPGLGLVISPRLVGLMGGKTMIDSDAGKVFLAKSAWDQANIRLKQMPAA